MTDDKTRLKNSFSKASSTYADNAYVQLKLAEKLMSLLSGKNYRNILELGCGSGLLTGQIVKDLNFECLDVNDLSESMLEVCLKSYKDDKRLNGLLGDAEKLELEKGYDLVISNACVQWFADFKGAVKKYHSALNNGGEFIFSTFVKGNFHELYELTGVGLDYLERTEIEKQVREVFNNCTFESFEYVSHFKSVKDMLTSFKKTGVSGLSHQIWTKKKLMDFTHAYKSRFSDENGIMLTWRALLFKASV
ncbi:MAG: malonyl-ACP O-methyltransferase BioC [Succinivibrio sp.]